MPGSTSRMGLATILGADNANTIDTTQAAAMATLDANAAMFAQGTFATRPTSSGGSPGKTGRLYYATDTGQVFYDFGTGWIQLFPVPDAEAYLGFKSTVTAVGLGATVGPVVPDTHLLAAGISHAAGVWTVTRGGLWRVGAKSHGSTAGTGPMTLFCELETGVGTGIYAEEFRETKNFAAGVAATLVADEPVQLAAGQKFRWKIDNGSSGSATFSGGRTFQRFSAHRVGT